LGLDLERKVRNLGRNYEDNEYFMDKNDMDIGGYFLLNNLQFYF
jgi:hypothetical protein